MLWVLAVNKMAFICFGRDVAFRVDWFLGGSWHWHWGWALETLIFLICRSCSLREEVLMNVACFDSWLFSIRLTPIVVALEGAQIDRVSDKGGLHQVVRIRLHWHCRARVDFDEPWFHFIIDHDIESENFKAAFEVGDQGAKIDCSEHYYLLHARPHQIVIITLVQEIGPKLGERPLQALVLYTALCILVNRAISQMRKDILQAVCIVSLRRETHDTLLEQIDLKRSHLGD